MCKEAEECLEKDELRYTSEGFEDFMQQAELSGISADRQDEIIALLLAEEVSLQEVLLDIVKDCLGALRKRKMGVIVATIMLCLFGFLVVSEYKARTGVMDFQPWQFEMGAFLKLWQIRLFSWFDWNAVFDSGECFVYNPYVYYYSKSNHDEVDCINKPRVIAQTSAANYTGIFNSEDFSLPLLLNNAQEDWEFNANSTLQQIQKIIAEDPQKNYPCLTYPGTAPKDEFIADPLLALIQETLTTADNTPLHLIFLHGCSRTSNKVLRRFIRRPKFVDSHIEQLGQLNAIAAKNSHKEQTVDHSTKDPINFMWTAQVIGRSVLTVHDADCPDNTPLTIRMEPGDIFASGPEDTVKITIPKGDGEVFIIENEFSTRESD